MIKPSEERVILSWNDNVMTFPKVVAKITMNAQFDRELARGDPFKLASGGDPVNELYQALVATKDMKHRPKTLRKASQCPPSRTTVTDVFSEFGAGLSFIELLSRQLIHKSE